MMRADVVLFVEHVARELDVACAVKLLAAQRRGLSIAIASLVYDLHATLGRYGQPRVVATPYCYSADDLGLAQVVRAWPRATYVNLAYEQIFQRINRSFKAPRDAFARTEVVHHAWSELTVDYLVQRGVPREHIVVNGNLTLGLYQPPYRAYSATRDELARAFGLDAGKRWVFIPENYGAAFYPDKQIQDYVRRGTTEAEAHGYRAFAQASLRELARWCKQAAEHTDAEVIIRPRPAAPREAFYQACVEAAGALPAHLHIIKDGTARDWILASDVVCSSYSTTLIEAAVAQRPILMLAPLPFPEFLHHDWYDLVPRVSDLSDFMAVVAGRTPPATWQPLDAWARATLLSRGDPIAGLVDLLAAVARGEAAIPADLYGGARSVPEHHTQPGRARLSTLRAVARRLLAPLRGRARRPASVRHEHDVVHAADVRARLARWERVLAAETMGTAAW